MYTQVHVQNCEISKKPPCGVSGIPACICRVLQDGVVESENSKFKEGEIPKSQESGKTNLS